MSLQKVVITVLCITFVLYTNNAQDDISPCPRLFVYEGKSPEPNRWYGIFTLLSDNILNGIWLSISFDRPVLQIGNWFGESVRRSETDFLIRNRNYQLKAHTPVPVRVFVEYDTSKPKPRLVRFRLNARPACPEDSGDESTTQPPKLMTSGDVVSRFTTTTVATPIRPVVNSNEGTEDDFFPGDFSFFNRTPINILDQNLEGECGKVVIHPKPLITHGQSTEVGEFPWHVALYYARGIDLTYICGASLISRKHVLTVAHCVTKVRKNIPLHPENLAVYLGKYYLKRFTGVGIQDKQVEKILPHPQFNPTTFINDIALLKLASTVDITDYVRPVCLWQEDTELQSVVGKEGNVVGWGFDETGTVTETLMQAKMPVVSHETCIFSFPDFYSRFTSPYSFCAGNRNGTSVCNGDSGGGMVFPKSNSNPKNPIWQLRGLVSISFALQNQFKCNSKHFIVFTDSAKYLDWIKQSMSR